MPQESDETEVSDLVQSLGLLVRRFKSMGDPQELTWTEAMVMRRLFKEGQTTSAELAREVGVKPQSMGSTVTALEQKGFVLRTPHPTDGRRMQISLSDQGVSLLQSARDSRRSWMAAALDRLPSRERDTLLSAGKIIKKLAES